MLGFGKTSAPGLSSAYALRSVAEDIKELAGSIVKDKKIILGGHDLGGAVAWRTGMWFPELVQGIFSVGTPFIPPSSIFCSLGDASQSRRLKNQRHPLQFRGTAFEEEIKNREQVGQFLNAMFGEVGAGGETGFDPAVGIMFENLPQIRSPPFLSSNELDYYVSQYFRGGQPRLKEPLNWYRTRAHNYLDELQLLLNPIKFSMPVLFVAITRGKAIPRDMLGGMG